VSDLCSLAGNWSYAVGLDDFTAITAANCADLSAASSFLRFEHLQAVVDANGLMELRRLAWVDVINAAVWILVVLVLEIDVRLQERKLFEGFALYASTLAKFMLYTALLLAAIYWGVKGDFVDFWDAFLWLVAFVFIEMNMFEWRLEEQETAASR
jgi:hypothetical protein